MAVTPKELEARSSAPMHPPPRLRETCTKPCSSLPSSPFSHLFPFISICRHYSPRSERSGKSGNNGDLPRVDRNGSSLPGKGFSRENLAEIKRGSMKIVVIE